LDDRGGSGGGTSDLLVISEQSSMESALTPVMATAAALTTTAGRGGSVTPVGRAESWQPMGTGRPDSLQPIGTTHSGRASPAAAHKASRGYSVIPEAHHATYQAMTFFFFPTYLQFCHCLFSHNSLSFPFPFCWMAFDP
jgi:hypothetical protein